MSTPRTENGSKRTAKPRTTTTTATKTRSTRSVADFSITDEQRRRMIQEAAYFRAERRGFAPGDEIADWLAAEAEISGVLETVPAGSQAGD